MKLYSFLSRYRLLNGYSLKLLLTAFVGIHIPLLGLGLLLYSEAYVAFSIREVLLITFILSFLSAIICLIAIDQLLSPVRKAKQALGEYLLNRKRPALPTHYRDEAGVLMRSVQHTIEHLDELLREKQDLIALLSHDLRSPVNTSSSLAELIKMKTTDPEIINYCDHILAQNTKQMSLLTTVLNLLREDARSQDELAREQVELKYLVEEALQQLRMDMTQKKISAEVDIPDALRVSVQRDVFVQVLINIIHNAIKFSPREKQISISADQYKTKVYINVRDEGIGFVNPTEIRNIFERFTSFRRKGTEGEPTTGIGMYLSRKIIRQHQGEIEVSSEGLNKGTTFRISLPV
ncbi:MAG: sensor histidine kinase [Cyclobacteriaceae bacterium]